MNAGVEVADEGVRLAQRRTVPDRDALAGDVPDRGVLARIVVTGATGLLGSAFLRLLPGAPRRLDRAALDPRTLRGAIAGLSPTLVIHCAADTDIDGAEADPARSFAVNAVLAGAVAAAAASCRAALLHASDTGCYGAWKATPYEEGDALRPTTVHHRAKADAERRVLAAHPAALVLRLGWLFGSPPVRRDDFVGAVLREAKGAAVLAADPGRLGCPTFADDVVRQALALLRQEAGGIYNVVGNGPPATRLDYVRAILAAAGGPARAVPAPRPRRAAVSPNEAAVNARLQAEGRDLMPPWRASLARHVRRILDETPPGLAGGAADHV